jgi:hypothetical protein
MNESAAPENVTQTHLGDASLPGKLTKTLMWVARQDRLLNTSSQVLQQEALASRESSARLGLLHAANTTCSHKPQ